MDRLEICLKFLCFSSLKSQTTNMQITATSKDRKTVPGLRIAYNRTATKGQALLLKTFFQTECCRRGWAFICNKRRGKSYCASQTFRNYFLELSTDTSQLSSKKQCNVNGHTETWAFDTFFLLNLPIQFHSTKVNLVRT